MPGLRFILTPALETRIRFAWAQHKRERTKAIDQLVRETGWPRPVVKYKARALGLVVEKRAIWTAQQDRQLMMLLGSRNKSEIAREIGRTAEAVTSRAAHLGLSSRLSESYTKADVKKLLGAPYHRITDWMERRWLIADVENEPTPRISDASLERFIWKYLDEIDLRLADQSYLKGVFRSGKDKSFQGKTVPGVARGGSETRARSRGAAGDVQHTLFGRSIDGSTAEVPPQLGQESTQHAASA